MSVLTEAWHTIVPPRDDPHGGLPPLLLLLTVVSGLVDGFSYLVLGHIFVVNMTGNVVFLAFALLGARGFSVAGSLVALAGFAIGALGAGGLGHRVARGRSHHLTLASLTEVVLVAAALAVAWSAAEPGSGAPRFATIVLLALAAGTQNAVARKLAVPDLTTTVLTLTFTAMASDSRHVGGPGARIGRRGLSVLAMFVGAVVSTAFVVHARRPWELVAAVVILAIVTLVASRLSVPFPTPEH